MPLISRAVYRPVMEIPKKSSVLRATARTGGVPKVVDFSRFKLSKGLNVFSNVPPRARIDPEFKAGGTIRRKFSAAITPKGISVNTEV